MNLLPLQANKKAGQVPFEELKPARVLRHRLPYIIVCAEHPYRRPTYVEAYGFPLSLAIVVVRRGPRYLRQPTISVCCADPCSHDSPFPRRLGGCV
jgi:hypothetical protein